jgi:hypothetical protein
MLIGVVLSCSACGMPASGAGGVNQPAAKITFDLSQLDDEGLTGPPDGRVAISYEFCIPATQAAQDEVRRIDTTVAFQPGARGRIGCARDQVLCIGSTHQRDWRAVLLRLASLDHIARIDRSFGE